MGFCERITGAFNTIYSTASSPSLIVSVIIILLIITINTIVVHWLQATVFATIRGRLLTELEWLTVCNVLCCGMQTFLQLV